MYRLLLLMMISAALGSLGSNVDCLFHNGSRACFSATDHAARKVLSIDWKPISVWPEEAKRYR